MLAANVRLLFSWRAVPLTTDRPSRGAVQPASMVLILYTFFPLHLQPANSIIQHLELISALFLSWLKKEVAILALFRVAAMRDLAVCL